MDCTSFRFKLSRILLMVFPAVSIFYQLPQKLSAQDINNQVFVIDHMTNPGEVLEEIPLPSSRLEGSFYLDDDWQIGNVYLESALILKNFRLKYDLEHNQLEIKTHEAVKVCPAEDLKKFEWTDKETGLTRNFLSSTQIASEGKDPGSGVYEILLDMEVDLLQKTSVKIIRSNYVPTVDVGQRNDRISKKENYFIYFDDTLYRIDKKKNKNQFLFSKCPALYEYAVTNNLNFNEQKDLIQVIEYFNRCLTRNVH